MTKIRLKIVSVVTTVLITATVPPVNAAYTVKPKVGQCFMLTTADVSASYATKNPIACSKTHNAETYLVAKWPLALPPEQLPEGEGLEVAKSLCYAWEQDGALVGYDFTFWAWYTPGPKAWARGERWLRCDAMKVVENSDPRKYQNWKGLKFRGKK